MRIVGVTDEHYKHIPYYVKTPSSRGLAAESDDGKVYIICILDSWTAGSVQMHINVFSPIGFRDYTFINEVFTFAFITADRLTAILVIGEDNVKAINLANRLGFKDLAHISDGHAPGVDSVLYEMRKADCKWLKRNRNG